MSRTQKNKDEKSPSARLRSLLYLLWEQDKEGFKEFEDYYTHKINKVIKSWKRNLKTENHEREKTNTR